MARVMVFIDGANLYGAIKEAYGIATNVKVDKFARMVTDGRELVRTYYYNSPAPPTANQIQSQKYWDSLGWIDGLRPRQGRIMRKTINTKCPKCHQDITLNSYIQKGVDTRIVVDMISLAQQDAYDVAVLVSGDSDLTETVEWIREHTKKKVENACVPCGAWSKQLREAADKRIVLSRAMIESCM